MSFQPDERGPAGAEEGLPCPINQGPLPAGEPGAPGWAAPSRDELSGHFAEQFLGFVSPEALAQAMGSLAAMLRADLILIDADSSRLSGKLAGTGLRVEAGVEAEAPHRIDMLGFFPDGEPVTGTRVTRPPSAGCGPTSSGTELLAHTGGVDSPPPPAL